MRRFKPRDVLRYTPVGGWHCRQGTAIVRGDGVAVDTYWGERGDGSESHRLTVEELADATLVFNADLSRPQDVTGRVERQPQGAHVEGLAVGHVRGAAAHVSRPGLRDCRGRRWRAP